MKKVSFSVHKWGVRALVAVGAAIGLTSCTHKIDPNIAAGVYGPPPGYRPQGINVVEDVYGPPVERIDSVNKIDEPEVLQPKKEQDKDIQ